jgi:hypothetical protein
MQIFETIGLVDGCQVCGMCSAVQLDQLKHGIDRGRRGNCRRNCSGNGAARSNGKTTAPLRIDRRVCWWRAMHAVSSGHVEGHPFGSG